MADASGARPAPRPNRSWIGIAVILVVATAGIAGVGIPMGSGAPPRQEPVATTLATEPVAPVTTAAPLAVVTDVAPGQSGVYTVQNGDTLGNLATRFGVSLDALAAANGIPNWDLILPGQTLVIPPP